MARKKRVTPDNTQQPVLSLPKKKEESNVAQLPLSTPRLLSIDEVMTILGVGLTKVNELIERDGLPAFVLGGRGRERRVDLNDFNDWLREQKKPT